MRSHFVSALALAGGLFLKANSWAAGGKAGWPVDLTGGDYEKGRALFFGKNPKCGGCHRLRGQGSGSAPDLTNLRSHDPAFTLSDASTGGAAAQLSQASFAARMPEGHQRAGVAATLDENSLRDLLVFALYDPPTRSPIQIAAVLGPRKSAAGAAGEELKPVNIVLVASKQDHGPGQHDYPAWQKKWKAMLDRVPKVTVSEAWEWPSPDQWNAADVVVCYFWNHDWSAARYRQIDEYQSRGGGLAIFHAATIADKEPEALAERIGLASQPGPTKYLHSPLLLSFVARADNPISSGFKQLNLIDEPYWPMFGDTNRIDLLATSVVEGRARPLIWTYQRGKGRVFASILGHYTWTFDDPLFRALALRGISWAAGRTTDRLDLRE